MENGRRKTEEGRRKAEGQVPNYSRYYLIIAISLFALGVLFLLTASSVFAQQPQPTRNLDDETLRVAKGLFCPVCPSTPLDVCETQACEQWRALIREKLAAGQTEEQIRQYFVDQYGERVLGAPRPQGFNLGVYILPFAALLGGIAVLFFTIRGWIRSRDQLREETKPVATVAPEVAERIQRELEENQ